MEVLQGTAEAIRLVGWRVRRLGWPVRSGASGSGARYQLSMALCRQNLNRKSWKKSVGVVVKGSGFGPGD